MEYDITALLANMAIGIGLGVGLVALYVWRTVRRFEKDLQEFVRETVAEEHFIGLVVEQDGDVIYAYTESDRQFVCQGTDLEQIRTGFKSRYPEKTAYLAGGDATLIEQFKAELLKLKENNQA